MDCKNCGTENMKHIGETVQALNGRGVLVDKHLPPFECLACTSKVYWTFGYHTPGWGDVEWDIVEAETPGMYYGVKYDWRGDEGGWVPASDYTEEYTDIERVKKAIENGRQWDQEDQFDPSKGGIPW